MANLQGIRRRIKSVKSMRQITKAMKLVSASRLRRAQERVIAARPYSKKLLEMLANLAAKAEEFSHKLMNERGDENLIVVLITADKGLCGAFNTNLLKAVVEFEKQHAGKRVSYVTIGRKGRDFIRKRGGRILAEYVGLVSKTIRYEQAVEIAQMLIDVYTSGKENEPLPDKVYLIYNEFKSALRQVLRIVQLLPVSQLASPSDQGLDYLYEQPPAEILGRLLPHYVETQIFQGLIESVAAEHAARMTAMDSANKNATEMISKLTLKLNRVRQASITKEIIEVVSGAAAI
ncbi:MAG: ATP synthase F1 subunit gamma [Acidobacteriota bacterium]|nr:ATP synthase F1 subunit gamma [Blastocatellia bacterium]MDW8412721.1 ATP synthase F1 subunit gamma [Acidobacteriota bacterium]